MSRFAKAIAPAVGTVLAVGIQWGVTGVPVETRATRAGTGTCRTSGQSSPVTSATCPEPGQANQPPILAVPQPAAKPRTWPTARATKSQAKAVAKAAKSSLRE